MSTFKEGHIEVENLTDYSDYERMELGGRVCYQSFDKITPESAGPFIKRLQGLGHHSVLGHAQLMVDITADDAVEIDMLCPQHLRHLFTYFYHEHDKVLVGAGYDAWLQLFQHTHVPVQTVFIEKFPDVFGDLTPTEEEPHGEVHFSLDSSINMPKDIAVYMFKETMLLTVDRATAMQLRTYRFASHSVESQRYVNYKRKGFYYITPPEVTEEYYDEWRRKKEWEISSYLDYLEMGFKPEFARTSLGQDIQTKMVITASLWEWKHIFNARMNSHTQSNARTAVSMVYDNLMTKYAGTPIEDFLRMDNDV